ncbi:FmdB family zinc ribbon protein [Candidatus Protofrankia californiensis]|uniref:FmdB family zinc ribbon protein n=1 Tax=Candidatus Protofrankia californiensis TaxID=1839754 RepID=UPI0010413C5B|nr:FmdB family zinc ribbon protein [Candidatus Protofrankia californiensis]
MPRYEYRCTACDRDLEVVQNFNDAALTECPTCNGKLRRVFSSVGVVFKGSGFYKTDSRSGGSSGARDRMKDKVGKDAGADTSGKETVGAGASAAGSSADGSSSPAGPSTSTSPASSASSTGSSTSSGGSGTAVA